MRKPVSGDYFSGKAALPYGRMINMNRRKTGVKERKTIRAQIIGDKAVLRREELERLVELARRAEKIDLELREDDVPTQGLMGLAERGGAFDFWNENSEEIYSVADGEPL